MKFAGERLGGGKLLAAGVAVLMGVGLLTRSEDLAYGIVQGLRVSGGILIPSLFPFMILCTYLVLTDAARVLSVPLRPLTKYLLRLPPEHGTVVFASLIGGYPVGAKMISGLLERGKLDKPTAERMMAFCFNGSPAFIITAVGAGILLDRRVGVALFGAQIMASFGVGVILSFKAPRIQASRAKTRNEGGAQVFVSAVISSSSAMLNVCAFATIFSGLLFMIRGIGFPLWLAELLRLDSGLADAFISGFFEVTAGCMSSAKFGGETAIVLVSIFCSWGGLSSIFQVIALFGETKLRWRLFFVARALHCVLAAVLSLVLYRAFLGEVSVMMHGAAPVMARGGNHWLTAACLLAMCAMLTISPTGKAYRIDR